MLTLNSYDMLKSGKLKMPEECRDFLSHIPASKLGPWSIEKIDVELDLNNLRMMREGRGCFPSRYTRLLHKRYGTVMSDTTAECMDA
jgi:hypothetical protein